MLDNKAKERIAQEAELPIYNDLVLPGIGKKFSAIERFVYGHQPINSADAEMFREQLKAAIVEAREAEATRAAGLVNAITESLKDGNLTMIGTMPAFYVEVLRTVLNNYNNPK